MNPDNLQKFAQNGRFIPGIYNYCDRWCERCPLSSRCLVFAMDRELYPDQESTDARNAVFWGKLTELLSTTTELLRKRAQEEGIDLDSVTSEDLAGEDHRREAAWNHACSVMAIRYADMAQAWLDRAAEDNVPAGPAGHNVSLHEALDIIRWYQHQIYVKVMRALESDWDEYREHVDEIPDDAGVQAKIALMGIDRSLAAWGVIRKHAVVPDDDLLNLMVHLDRMRRIILPHGERYKEPFPLTPDGPPTSRSSPPQPSA